MNLWLLLPMVFGTLIPHKKKLFISFFLLFKDNGNGFLVIIEKK